MQILGLAVKMCSPTAPEAVRTQWCIVQVEGSRSTAPYFAELGFAAARQPVAWAQTGAQGFQAEKHGLIGDDHCLFQTHSLSALGLGETNHGLVRLLSDMTCLKAQELTSAGQGVEPHDASQGQSHLAHAHKGAAKRCQHCRGERQRS